MSPSYIRIFIILQSTKPGTLDKRLWLKAHGSALLAMKTGIKVECIYIFFFPQCLNLKSFGLGRREIFLFYEHPMFRTPYYFYWAPKWAHLYHCADMWNSLSLLIGKSTSLQLPFSINCVVPSVFGCYWARLLLFMLLVFISFN